MTDLHQGIDRPSVALEPGLTTEDLRVLRGLPSSGAPGVRYTKALRRLVSEPNSRVYWTLTGLRHLGYVTEAAGWWKRTAKGDRYLQNLERPPIQGALI